MLQQRGRARAPAPTRARSCSLPRAVGVPLKRCLLGQAIRRTPILHQAQQAVLMSPIFQLGQWIATCNVLNVSFCDALPSSERSDDAGAFAGFFLFRVLSLARREGGRGRKDSSSESLFRVPPLLSSPLLPHCPALPLPLPQCADRGHACWQPGNGMPSHSESGPACGVRGMRAPSPFLHRDANGRPAMGRTDRRTDKQSKGNYVVHAAGIGLLDARRPSRLSPWGLTVLVSMPASPLLPTPSDDGRRRPNCVVFIVLSSLPPSSFFLPSVACLFSFSQVLSRFQTANAT